jgi:hypothetical protein
MLLGGGSGLEPHPPPLAPYSIVVPLPSPESTGGPVSLLEHSPYIRVQQWLMVDFSQTPKAHSQQKVTSAHVEYVPQPPPPVPDPSSSGCRQVTR